MDDVKLRIDSVFIALSDATRRDIFDRTTNATLTVNQIATDYDMSLAAVSKHIKVLEDAGLIAKQKKGRFVFITANLNGLTELREYIQTYDHEG